MTARGRADYLELGDWNVVCYDCGRKRKASTMVRQWQGFYVCPEHWTPRQPQDFARGVPDNQTPPWSQPMPSNEFVAVTYRMRSVYGSFELNAPPGTRTNYDSTTGNQWAAQLVCGEGSFALNGQDAGLGESVELIAVANGTASATSTDGETWSAGGALQVSRNWLDMAYNNTGFCAVSNGANGTSSYTIDASSWGGGLGAAQWQAIAALGSTFCAIVPASATAAISTDGTNWTNVSLPAANTWLDIAASLTHFCVIDASTNGAVSTDGTTWSPITIPTGATLVSAHHSRFVVIIPPAAFAYSDDNGANWTSGVLPVSTSNWVDITWTGLLFCLISSDGYYLVTNENLFWQEQASFSFSGASAVIGSGNFVAVIGTATDVCRFTNNGGVSWQNGTLPSSANWSALALRIT